MSKTTKIIAALGVVAGLGVAALPAFTYATDPSVSGDVQVLVDVNAAIAMKIEGNNDAGTHSAGTFAVGTPTADPAEEGFYEYNSSTGVYAQTEDTTVDGSKTYYKPVTPTYGSAKAYSPTGATTIDGQSVADFTLDHAAATSSSWYSLLPNAVLEGDRSSLSPVNNFGSTITVWTNNDAGYTLDVIDADADTNLTHSSGEYNIPTSSSAVEAGYARWNFDSTPDSTKSSYAGKTNQAMPAAGGTAVVINQTSAKTSGGSATVVDYNVSTAADQATGTYSDTIVYTATTNN